MKPYPFDFYLTDYNILIEYDGIQHFEPIKWFGGLHRFKKLQDRDKTKNNFSENNNIDLIRISYKDYENIEKILLKIIENESI